MIPGLLLSSQIHMHQIAKREGHPELSWWQLYCFLRKTTNGDLVTLADRFTSSMTFMDVFPILISFKNKTIFLNFASMLCLHVSPFLSFWKISFFLHFYSSFWSKILCFYLGPLLLAVFHKLLNSSSFLNLLLALTISFSLILHLACYLQCTS